MSELPDLVPLFPLPEHVLLPGFANPYRVFEPRYRALVGDLLTVEEDERWLAVPRLQPGWRDDYYGKPDICDVAVLARMIRCDSQPNGHFLIVVQGQIRCRFEELESDREYRLGKPELLPDLAPEDGPEQVKQTLDALSQSLLTLGRMLGVTTEFEKIIRQRSDSEQFVYRVAATVMQKAHERQDLLEERYLEKRARKVISAVAFRIAKASAEEGGGLPS